MFDNKDIDPAQPTPHQILMKALHYKQPISTAMYTRIKRHGILTGSYVFGGYKKGISDIDYIIRDIYLNQQDLSDHFVYHNADYDESDYFAFYVRTHAGRVLNILLMKNKQAFMQWNKATRIMHKLLNIPILNKAFRDKQIRVKMFELLKEICA